MSSIQINIVFREIMSVIECFAAVAWEVNYLCLLKGSVREK